MDPLSINLLVGLLVGITLGCGGTIGALQALARLGLRSARSQAQEVLSTAQLQAETIRKEADLLAKEEALQRRERADREIEEARRSIREQESRLEKRADTLDEKLDLINKKERDFDGLQRYLSEQQAEVQRKNAELNSLLVEHREQLLQLAGLTADQAREQLLRKLDQELAHELGCRIRHFEQELGETSRQKAHEILATAIQRYAASHTAETTTSTVDIPSDDMKGRIIGREGRNIRAFEKATGVDVIVDDTPGIVIVTGFDSIRREIARISLEKLIQDGRIHPARIEEIVAETQEEMEDHILRCGHEAAVEAGVPNLHEKLLHYLGRLKFRTSYSQNVLRHSIEVAYLTGMLAEEIGLDGALGRRAGLLHDIGKAADHEMEGGHPAIGADLCKRFGEPPEVVHAALGHHDDLRVDRPYTVLTAAADAISASRPGARRDTLEKYVRRLEELEGLVCGFPGVETAYAIQAGREVRILVDSQELDDSAAHKLCRDVAQAIESQLTYPGAVKVTVLREIRAVEYAR